MLLQQKVLACFWWQYMKDVGFVIEEEQEVQLLSCCKICNVHISVRLCGSTLLLCRYSRCIVSKPVTFCRIRTCIQLSSQFRERFRTSTEYLCLFLSLFFSIEERKKLIYLLVAVIWRHSRWFDLKETDGGVNIFQQLICNNGFQEPSKLLTSSSILCHVFDISITDLEQIGQQNLHKSHTFIWQLYGLNRHK